MAFVRMLMAGVVIVPLAACNPMAMMGTPNPAGGLFAAGVAAQDCSYYTNLRGQSMDAVTLQAVTVSAAQAGCAF